MKIPFCRGGLILAIISLLILSSGCVDTPISEPGIEPQSIPDTDDSFYPISFGEGINLMNSFFSEDLAIQNASYPLYYVHGRGVNREGKAEQWIFGTIINADRYFVIVESNRQVLVPYQTDIPEKVIESQKIILPDALIRRNMQFIKDAFGSNDSLPLLRIELMDDVYTLTYSAGSVNRILHFDAFTGEPIRS